MRSLLSVEIDRPIEEVFEKTGNVCDWSITCVDHELIEEKPEVVGTRFKMITEDRGHRMEFQGVTTGHQAPTFYSAHLEGKQFDIDVDYKFEDLSGRTRVTQESKVSAKGFSRVLFALLGWAFKKASCDAQEQELGSLKRYCETGETVR